jgi:outer membrane protein TolC
VAKALEHYPSIRVSDEQVSAAAAGINLARTAYLPRLDALGQVNRATRNNVFGLILPNSVIPSISGPVLGTNGLNSVWGTAVGALVSWEPFDFGLRNANVSVAEASRRRADAAAARTRFEVSVLTADSFLTLLAAEETLHAADAAVGRTRVLNQVVEALVKSELRPGADASRAQAEQAVAETQRIQAQQAVDVARITLAQFTGLAPAAVEAQPGPLLGPPPEPTEATNVSRHPLALEQNAAIEESKARERALNRTYFPKFNLQGTSYARGEGNTGPNIQNWALGFTATLPIFDFASIRARKQIEAHRERSEEARYQQVLTELNSNVARARAMLNAARLIARNTPVQLEAARQSQKQATARYRAGLSDVVNVADAERLLNQAEIDDALARLSVWRALLSVAAAQGDLQPFLDRTQ